MESGFSKKNRVEIVPEADCQRNVWESLKRASELKEIKVQNFKEYGIQLSTFRAKIYKFKDGKWCEKGVGECRFSKVHDLDKVRFICRHDRSSKILLNHYVLREGIIL